MVSAEVCPPRPALPTRPTRPRARTPARRTAVIVKQVRLLSGTTS